MKPMPQSLRASMDGQRMLEAGRIVRRSVVGATDLSSSASRLGDLRA
jgi:hypothetical protein